MNVLAISRTSLSCHLRKSFASLNLLHIRLVEGASRSSFWNRILKLTFWSKYVSLNAQNHLMLKHWVIVFSLCPWTLLVDTRRHSRLIISHQTGNTLCVCNFWVSCIFETWLDKPVKTRFETSLEPELTVAYSFTFMQPLFAEEKSPTSESETETLVGHVDPPVQAFRCCYSTCVWNPTPSSTTCAQADLQNCTTLHVDSLQFEMSNHLQLLLLPNIAIISAKRHSDVFWRHELR